MDIVRHLHGIINLASLTFLDTNFMEIIRHLHGIINLASLTF